MSIAGYVGWPAYDTFLIVSLSDRPIYDPNPLKPNPNQKKPVLGSYRVCGSSRTLTPLLISMTLKNNINLTQINKYKIKFQISTRARLDNFES